CSQLGFFNSQPMAKTHVQATTEDQMIHGQLPGFDWNGDPLAFFIIDNGNKGTVTMTDASTGTYIYSPNPYENGIDRFTYQVHDGITYSDAATVTIQIAASNNPPVSQDGLLTLKEDYPRRATLSGSDVDGDNLLFSIVSNGRKGRVRITDTSTGTYVYAPHGNKNGSDSFTYKVNDGSMDSNISTVIVTIRSINDRPIAQGGTLTTNQNESLDGVLAGRDIEGDNLIFSIESNGSRGTAVITDPLTGAYTYTPDTDQIGTDHFTYRVDDGISDSEIATVMLTIEADADHDGIGDTFDAFPHDPHENLDSDLDGLGNNADTDDDNDGIPDTEDAYPYTSNTYRNSLNMDFKLIASGSFQMGCQIVAETLQFSCHDHERPVHAIDITAPFYMATTETTKEQWIAIMGEDPSDFSGCLDCPIEMVSWDDVQTFISKINQKGEGIYRLPTEAEWEYACRAGRTATNWSTEDLSNHGWYAKNSHASPTSLRDDSKGTHPVA
ncbi:tandem-95 repeat protein, partial [Magnetococcales bacterium HHB-1]